MYSFRQLYCLGAECRLCLLIKKAMFPKIVGRTARHGMKVPHGRARAQTVERVLATLDLLAESDGAVSVTEAAHRLSVNKSSMHRILSSVLGMGYIEQDSKTLLYSLSPKILHFAHAYHASSRLRRVALPYLVQLAEETHACVSLGILRGSEVLFVERIMPPKLNAVFSGAGRRVALHCTANGKVLASFANQETIRELLQRPLHAYTPNTHVDPESVQDELETIRECGWASDEEEYRIGVFCIAVPVRDRGGKVIASLGVSLSNPQRFSETREGIVEAIKSVASMISGLLGYD